MKKFLSLSVALILAGSLVISSFADTTTTNQRIESDLQDQTVVIVDDLSYKAPETVVKNASISKQELDRYTKNMQDLANYRTIRDSVVSKVYEQTKVNREIINTFKATFSNKQSTLEYAVTMLTLKSLSSELKIRRTSLRENVELRKKEWKVFDSQVKKINLAKANKSVEKIIIQLKKAITLQNEILLLEKQKEVIIKLVL